jgi:hypothetical protein
MKTQSKPIVALASGTILLFGVLCQTAQAQSVVSGQADLALTEGSGTSDLSVGYDVTENEYGGFYGFPVYTYTYTIAANPFTVIEGLFIDFDTTYPGIVVGASITGSVTGSAPNGHLIEGATGTEVAWYFLLVPGSKGTATLSFESDFGPGLDNASVFGSDENNLSTDIRWSSSPGGEQLVAPGIIPEPATTTLLTLSLLLLTPTFRLIRPHYRMRSWLMD